ncbi:UNVERIFIED_CONTAM: hypothetical protein LK11_23380, partial [Mumia flava]
MTTIDETTSMSNERSGTAAGKPRGPRFLIVQNSPRHRAVQAVLIALTVVALLWAAGQPTFRLGQFTNVFIIAIAVVGLNIVTGYTGL